MLIDVGSLIINTDHIVRIEYIAGQTKGTNGSRVWLVDGTYRDVSNSPYEIVAQSGTIVPNTDKYRVVMAAGPDESGKFGPDFWSIPVLAFRVTSPHGMPSPVTTEGEIENYANQWALVDVEGGFHFGDGERADDVEEWLSVLNGRVTAP